MLFHEIEFAVRKEIYKIYAELYEYSGVIKGSKGHSSVLCMMNGLLFTDEERKDPAKDVALPAEQKVENGKPLIEPLNFYNVYKNQARDKAQEIIAAVTRAKRDYETEEKVGDQHKNMTEREQARHILNYRCPNKLKQGEIFLSIIDAIGITYMWGSKPKDSGKWQQFMKVFEQCYPAPKVASSYSPAPAE